MYTPKEMTGRIFDNTPDKTHEKQPDFTGSITVNGEVLRVSAWHSPPDASHRVGSYGLRLQTMDEYERQKAARASSQNPPQPPAGDPGNDVPF